MNGSLGIQGVGREGPYDFEVLYARTMRRIWSHGSNDQRAEVLGWLASKVPLGSRIVDVGSGDAYYLQALRPRSYCAVEPNLILRTLTHERATWWAGQSVVFPDVAALARSGAIAISEAVLLIHVLFYLDAEELNVLLDAVSRSRATALVVIPDRANSVSAEFERTVGIPRSRAVVDICRDVLGPPTERKRVRSHLTLPLHVSNSELAFVVSHHLMRAAVDLDLLGAAESFVASRIGGWHRGNYLALPQSQLLDIYAPLRRVFLRS